MEMSIDDSTSTNISGTSFKISDDSSKLFSMLSSFLYSNKELAVLHELSSNAIDAHTMVGKESVPIEVHLPTAISPNLIVRDFGPGLSPENVIRFLTTYGESNKTKSKNMIGGYGIGSKSPAAVTDTWQVISRHAGVLTHYQILIDNTGVPLLSKLREVPTNETGIDVIVPTRPNDISVWSSAASGAYQFYSLRPDIVGPTRPMFFDYVKMSEQPNFSIVQSNYRKITAIASGRGYDVDFTQVLAYVSPLYKKFLTEFNKTILFNFDIGAFDVDLSREKVRYSDKTLKILGARLDEVGEYFYKSIHDEVDGKNVHEYTILMSKWYTEYNSSVFHLIAGNPHNITSGYRLNTLQFEIADAAKYKVSIGGKIGVLTDKYKCGRTGAVTKLWGYNTLVVKTQMFDRIMFVKNDHPSVASRVRHLTKTSLTVVVLCDSFVELGSAVEPHTILGSSLPAAPKLLKAAAAIIKSPVYELRGNRFFKTHDIIQKGVVTFCVTFSNANTSSSVIDEGKMAFLKSYYAMMGIPSRVLGIKQGTKIPKGVDSLSVAYNRIIDFYKLLMPAYKEYSALVEIRDGTIFKIFELMIDNWGTNIPDDIRDIHRKITSVRPHEDPISSIKVRDFAFYNSLVRHMDLTSNPLSCNITLMIDDFANAESKYELLCHLVTHSIFDSRVLIDGVRVMTTSAGTLLAKVVKYVKIVDSTKGVV